MDAWTSRRLRKQRSLLDTVLFNLSTFDALREHLSATQANRLVWTPDALGSICFLIGAVLLLPERTHDPGSR